MKNVSIRIILLLLLVLSFSLPVQVGSIDHVNSLQLTPEETEFLASHPTIQVSNELDYPPFDFADDGQPRGYSIDLLNLLAKRIGLKLNYVNGYTWEQLLEQSRQGRLDLMHTLNRTPEREKYAHFSTPYRRYKNYFIIRKEADELTNIRQLYGKTLAVIKGWSLEEYLSQRHPEVRLLRVDNYSAVLDAVSTGQADAMVGEAPAAAYMIQKEGRSDLALSGWFKEFDRGKSRKLHFMAHKDAPELTSMLNKAYASLDPIDLEGLERKWFGAQEHTEKMVSLTFSEQQYIEKTPEIVLGSGASFDPFVILGTEGRVSGYDVDIARLITDRTGLKIRLELGIWAEIQKKAEKKQLDGISTSSPSDERKKYYTFSDPYFRSTALVIVKKGNPEKIYRLEDTAGKRVAVQKGNILFDEVAAHFKSELIIDTYKDQYELIQAVVNGRADFTVIDSTAFYIAEKIGLRGFIEGAFPVGPPFNLVFSLRNDQPELVSIMNKGLASISELEKNEIRQRWFDSWQNEDLAGHAAPSLTSAEVAFLAEKSVLRVCGYAERMPYQQIDKSGQHLGLAADYSALFSKGIGVKLQPVQTSHPSAPLVSLRQGDCDVVLLSDVSYPPTKDVNLTTPYLSFPYVVATRHDKLFVDDISQLLDKRFAVIKGASVVALLQKRYPGIRLQEVSGQREGLEAVRSGTSFGYIDSSVAISYSIQSEFMPEVKIAGKIPINIEFRAVTRHDQPLLGTIFQKIIGSMSEQENRQILNNWIAVKYEQGVDYRIAWKTFFIAISILAAILFWNRRLSRERKRAEIALLAERTAIQQNFNFMDMISHEYRTPLSVLSSSLDLLERKTAAGSLADFDKQLGKMRKSTDRLRNIFEISLDEKRVSDASIKLDMQKVQLNTVVESAIEYVAHIHPEHTVLYHPQVLEDLIVSADTELLLTALNNLLDNACKYSEPTAAVNVELNVNAGMAVITIIDKGIGICADELDQVFAKYYRSSSVGQKPGAGVGLFLVKKIVELHQGIITLVSSVDDGTEVKIQLPLWQ